MNKVVKYEASPGVTVEKTLFRSALIKDCVRFLYSREDRRNLVVLDNTNEIVNTKEYLHEEF